MLESVRIDEGQALDFEYIAQAKTQQNSLFLAKASKHREEVGSGELRMIQYIPLPVKKVAPEEYQDLFQQLRTPVFLAIFIAVLLMQIYFKKKRDAKTEASRAVGPLERTLSGRSPDGKQLDPSQIKQIRDLDGILGQIGQLGEAAED